jgi:hypothetical protein
MAGYRNGPDARADYMATLESASVGHDIVPFTRFLAGLIGKTQTAS